MVVVRRDVGGEQGLTSHARKKDVLRLFQKILLSAWRKKSEEAPKKLVQGGIYREGVVWRGVLRTVPVLLGGDTYHVH